jgi:cobalt/nickel transport system permease protein
MTDQRTAPRRRLPAWWWLVGLAVAALVVVVAALLASGDPDGLERVAIDQGFSQAAEDAPFSIIPDYTVPGIGGSLSTIVAGLIGVVVIFGVVWLIGRALARRSREG